jgi:hypothetical protein
MAGYPAHENSAKILDNLREAAAKAEGETKERIEKAIAGLDPIKDNRTFMRTRRPRGLQTAPWKPAKR